MGLIYFRKVSGCNIILTQFLLLQIKTTAQLDAALSFFGVTASEDFKLNEFEEACGVGMKKGAFF